LFIFIVLGQNTSTPVSREWKDRYDKGFSGGRVSVQSYDEDMTTHNVSDI
jgi:hypothetical protein